MKKLLPIVSLLFIQFNGNASSNNYITITPGDTVAIFPTPAIDFITVKGKSKQGDLYSIIGMDGKEVLSGRLNSTETEIFLQGVAPGTYYFAAEGYEKKTFTVIQP